MLSANKFSVLPSPKKGRLFQTGYIIKEYIIKGIVLRKQLDCKGPEVPLIENDSITLRWKTSK